MRDNKKVGIQRFRFFIFLALTLILQNPVSAEFRIVGYLTNWGNLASDASKVDYSRVTHVNIAFLNPDVNGNLSPTNGISTVVALAHSQNSKVLASLGGAGATTNWSSLLMTASSRTNFISLISKLVTTYQLDGIDIDIEGDLLNGTLITSGHYESFVVELGDSLHTKNKLMTGAVATWFGYYVTPKAAQAFDWINIMSYDAAGTFSSPGQPAPYSFALSDLNTWSYKVTDKSKMVIGVPSYGTFWPGSTSLGSKDIYYNTIVSQYPRAANQDSIIPSPNASIYYNGITTIINKTKLALQSASGIMMWTLQYDLPTSNPNSLILAISQASLTTGIKEDQLLEIPTSIAPNPFSNKSTINFSIPSPSNTKILLSNVLNNSPITLLDSYLMAGEHSLNVHGSELTPGLYFLTIFSDGKQKVIKLIKE